MNTGWLIAAIIMLALGHYFKMLRWKQFIEIYEKPNKNILLQALGLGYAINFFVPYHAGDFFRILWAGRRMKNGVGMSLATVIIDRYLDIIVVGALFFVFWLGGFQDVVTVETLLFYTGCAVLLVALSFLFLKYSWIPKKLMLRFSALFNENIELKLMNFFWTMISSFKDMFQKVRLGILLINTFIMWALYLVSYGIIGKYISQITDSGPQYRIVDIFMLLFSRESLNSASFMQAAEAGGVGELFHQIPGVMAVYIILPLVLLLIAAAIGSGLAAAQGKESSDGAQSGAVEYKKLLPHVNKQDRLQFLETYFEGKHRSYLKNYLEINQNVSIIKDYSAGSNATTLLCMDKKQTFFRKYAFGADGEKLNQQVLWLQGRQGSLPVTKLLRESHTDEYCFYDMPYENTAVSMFQYIHSMPIDRSRRLLRTILEDLRRDLYQNLRKAQADTVREYIAQKVEANLQILYRAKELKALMDYEELIINGKAYKNLRFYGRQLSAEKLYPIFAQDEVCEIHGDLTIENIICMSTPDDTKGSYYLIDPNTGNILDSPNLDYAKLLQSLHGGYEFLMNTQNVTVRENRIDFLFLKSTAYEQLYSDYAEYLKTAFGMEKVRSIFYHEAVHWLRLMPYKLRKDGKKAVIFYAGLLMVLNDIAD